MSEWISVKDRLPEDGTDCWVLQRSVTEKRNGYYSQTVHLRAEARQYKLKNRSGKDRANPWGINLKNGVPRFEVLYWIPVPEWDCREGCGPKWYVY